MGDVLGLYVELNLVLREEKDLHVRGVRQNRARYRDPGQPSLLVRSTKAVEGRCVPIPFSPQSKSWVHPYDRSKEVSGVVSTTHVV